MDSEDDPETPEFTSLEGSTSSSEGNFLSVVTASQTARMNGPSALDNSECQVEQKRRILDRQRQRREQQQQRIEANRRQSEASLPQTAVRRAVGVSRHKQKDDY